MAEIKVHEDDTTSGLRQKRELAKLKQKKEFSTAEISELWELAKEDTITLTQAFEVIQALGGQWHPQAERALVDCYLRLDDPLSGWAALALNKYYTYSSLVNVKRILQNEREEHFTQQLLRARAEKMIPEVERRLSPSQFVKLEIRVAGAPAGSPQQYSAEVIKSSDFPEDEGTSTTFGFSDEERKRAHNFLQTWQTHALPSEDLIEIGNLLYQKLFGGRLTECLANCLLRSRQEAAFGGVMITLHLGDPWILGLPWSTLYDNSKHRFLVHDCDVTITLRSLAERSRLRPWDGSRTTRLLVIESQPDEEIRSSLLQKGIGLVDVDTSEEADSFNRGLRDWNRDSDMLLCVDITKAKDSMIFEFMSDNHFDYDAVHYFGHCLHDGENPYLVFMDARGQRGPLRTAEEFVNLVGKNRALQLVTLVACQSAVRGAPDASTPRSMAESLLAAGVPTVVAMQTAIRRSTGLTFTRHFYHELIRTGSAQAAFHSAVQAIDVRPLGNAAEPEWAAPVLFVHR